MDGLKPRGCREVEKEGEISCKLKNKNLIYRSTHIFCCYQTVLIHTPPVLGTRPHLARSSEKLIPSLIFAPTTDSSIAPPLLLPPLMPPPPPPPPVAGFHAPALAAIEKSLRTPSTSLADLGSEKRDLILQFFRSKKNNDKRQGGGGTVNCMSVRLGGGVLRLS